MRIVLQIIGHSPTVSEKLAKKHLGKLIKEMDTDTGTFETCEAPNEAQWFHSPGEALRAWKKPLPSGELNQLAMKWSIYTKTVI